MPAPDAYAKRIASTRRLVLAAAALDGLLVVLVACRHDLRADRDLLSLLAFEAALTALLLAYAALLGPKPRPWLSLAMVAPVAVDQALWFGPRWDFAAGPCGMTCGSVFALVLAVALLQTVWDERLRLRARPESRSAAGWVLGLAALAWAGAAWTAVGRPASHLTHRQGQLSVAADCRADLRRWYLAEKAYRLKAGRYSESPDDLQFHSVSSAYSLAWSHLRTPDVRDWSDGFGPLAGGATLGLEGTCPNCEIAAVCAWPVFPGESALDAWSVSTRDRQLADGSIVRAGVPFHERNGLGVE